MSDTRAHLILYFERSSLNSLQGPFYFSPHTPPAPCEQTSPCLCASCCDCREFGRWKVNSLAVEKRDGLGGSGGLALPLDPDFQHTIRQLGRRPTLQAITESLIKKYGTHLLVSATLGGTVEYAPLQSKPDSHILQWVFFFSLSFFFFYSCTWGPNFTVCCFQNNKEYSHFFSRISVLWL